MTDRKINVRAGGYGARSRRLAIRRLPSLVFLNLRIESGISREESR